MPSRTRFGWCRVAVLSIGDQASVHDVGQASFEAAQGFPAGLPFGAFALVVGASLGLVTDFGDRHDVQGGVQLPVAMAREPVSFDVT